LSWIRDTFPDWSVVKIDGMPHESVLDQLRKTSIFLSFSHAEGVGLPPVEAALCGCYVVGYTGGAGQAFFKRPLLRAVEEGDFLAYFREIRELVEQVSEAGDLAADAELAAQQS